MNPDQNNPAPTDYTSSDYSVGSMTAPAGPQVVPPQQSQVNPNSTQNALQISEIRDGIVIMNDGSFRAVVMCHSINFDLMSPQEREAVEFSYQGFLNSLYFPVQIFIRSQKVDMRPYLEKIDKIRKEQDNMLLGLLMEDYIAFLADIAQQTNIMDKKFYLVIKFPDVEQDVRKALKQSAGFFTGMAELLSPGKPTHVVVDENTLENAKTELRNRVQAVMQGLAQCGIQSLPLDTEELIELYYDAYNPDTATRQEIKNFNDLIAPVVTKGEGQAPQPQLDKETP
jgi:type IV secretory pathway VirB4 component